MNSSPTTPNGTSAMETMNVSAQATMTMARFSSAHGSARCAYHARTLSNPRPKESMTFQGFQRERSAHRPASVGVTVKETKREVSVEMTTTIANSERLRPTCPWMNAIGRKTTTSTSVMTTAAAPISIRPSYAASSGACLRSVKWRSMFSKTTVESSTRIPMTSDMPSIETVSSVMFIARITVSAIASDVGMEMQTTSALRHERRKKSIAIAVRKIASSSVFVTMLICCCVNVD